MICHFGDLGIIRRQWPLINNGQLFNRSDWPVPLFHRVLPIPEGKAVIVEYGQDYSGLEAPICERITPVNEEILKLPEDGLFGSGAIEILLTKLLNKKNY